MTLTVSEMREVNARWHYGRIKYRGPFDLWFNASEREVYLRIVAGRRALPVPAGAKRVGRYDRLSTWDDVKADLRAVLSMEAA